MAAEQATNPEVQRFGQRMVTDHTKANQELMALAQSKTSPSPERQINSIRRRHSARSEARSEV